MISHDVKCKTCDIGTLRRQNKYRMSGVVVAIGYILLVPSVLGLLFTALMFVMTAAAVTTSKGDGRTEHVKTLRSSGVPERLIDRALSGDLTAAEARSLTKAQRSTADRAKLSLNASDVGSGIGLAMVTGIYGIFGVLCFVGGLLGWLLVMKKKVLECDYCSAVVSAS